jgi:hypothetical protein
VNPIFLPIATVQHDFEAVVTDVREGVVPSEDFWISCYHQNEPSVHGKVRAELDETDRNLVLLEGRDGVQIERGGVSVRSSLPLAADSQAQTFFSKALVFRFLSSVGHCEIQGSRSKPNLFVARSVPKPADRMYSQCYPRRRLVLFIYSAG